LILLSGCQPKSDVKVVTNPEQAAKTLDQIRTLTEEPLLKANAGLNLTEADQKNLKLALPLAQALVDYDPTQIGTMSLRAKIESAIGDTKAAEATYKQAAKLAPANPSPEISYLIADIHNELGKLAFSRQDFPSAKGEFQTAIKRIPNDVRFLTNLASVQIELEELSSAKQTIAQIRKLDPTNGDAADLEKLIQFAEGAAK